MTNANIFHTRVSWLQGAASGFAMIMLASCASTSPSAPAMRGPEQVFESPAQAVDALVAANRANDKTALLKILGPNAKDLISSGDPIADKQGRAKFLAAYDAAHILEEDGPYKDVLVIGNEEWPMPIPLVRTTDGWQFDTDAGAQEIINRRIGRNELNAIAVSRAYVEAQYEFSSLHSHAGVKGEFAQKLVSNEGKHDGLYWPVKSDEAASPLGPLVAHASAHGYAMNNKPEPYRGYIFRILKSQGPHAAGGEMGYMEKGHMVRGFALIAVPAKYGNSGVMTFIVNRSGIVYEKNLGPDTRKRAAAIQSFDPGQSWTIVK